MSYDGRIVCQKCRRALYLGAFKDGRFLGQRRGSERERETATAMYAFICDHFAHGPLMVLGEGHYEQFCESLPPNERPRPVYIRVTHDLRVSLVEKRDEVD